MIKYWLLIYPLEDFCHDRLEISLILFQAKYHNIPASLVVLLYAFHGFFHVMNGDLLPITLVATDEILWSNRVPVAFDLGLEGCLNSFHIFSVLFDRFSL